MKTGRPPKSAPREKLVAISVRLPADLVKEIGRRASDLSINIPGRFSVVVRELLERALERK